MLQPADFQRLIADIESGKCAVVLGPEIFTIGDTPMQTHVSNRLMERFGDQIAAYYERDGFYLLRNPDDKPEMQDEVQFLYQDIEPPEMPLRQIVEIPFSMVLSVNPDTFLRDLSISSGLPNRFAWFDARKQEEFELPDGEPAEGALLRERIPMYYNLCGCVEKPSTLVLDYDDLFRLLEGMLGAPKLPEKLLARLKDTTSYLFLGFQFDRWHTQLILRLLDVKNAARRFAVQSPLPKEKDTEAFLINQFRIKFLGSEADLIDQIYNHYKTEGLLRPANQQAAPTAQAVTTLLMKGNLEKALIRLAEAAEGTEYSNDAILLNGRFNMWQEQQRKGIADSRDLQVNYNKILDDALYLNTKMIPA